MTRRGLFGLVGGLVAGKFVPVAKKKPARTISQYTDWARLEDLARPYVSYELCWTAKILDTQNYQLREIRPDDSGPQKVFIQTLVKKK